jgi:hypothetical protein
LAFARNLYEEPATDHGQAIEVPFGVLVVVEVVMPAKIEASWRLRHLLKPQGSWLQSHAQIGGET